GPPAARERAFLVQVHAKAEVAQRRLAECEVCQFIQRNKEWRMMHVTQLRLVMDVVRTGRMPALVPIALQRWDGRPGPVSHVRSGSNHIFKCEYHDNVRFLRLVPEQRRRRQAIEAELAFVLHVAATGVPVAPPLLSAHGQYVEEIVWRDQCYY